MNEGDVEIGEYVLRQVLVGFGGGANVERFRFLDHRIDHVGLPAGGNLLADELQDARPCRFAAQHRFHRLPARRQLIEHRDIEITVESESQGARDRRGRHHQHVGIGAGPAKSQALVDAEAVLLIDDHEPQSLKIDIFLYERVCADNQLGLTGAEALERRAPLTVAQTAAQEFDTDWKTPEQPCDRAGVLFR